MRERGAKCAAAFGEVLKTARENKNLRQETVAEELGITQAYLSTLENGKRSIDLDLTLKACKLLNIDLAEFIKNYGT